MGLFFFSSHNFKMRYVRNLNHQLVFKRIIEQSVFSNIKNWISCHLNIKNFQLRFLTCGSKIICKQLTHTTSSSPHYNYIIQVQETQIQCGTLTSTYQMTREMNLDYQGIIFNNVCTGPLFFVIPSLRLLSIPITSASTCTFCTGTCEHFGTVILHRLVATTLERYFECYSKVSAFRRLVCVLTRTR